MKTKDPLKLRETKIFGTGRLRTSFSLVLILAAFGIGGCETAPTAPMAKNSETKEVFTIQVGDVLKISFPGAPNLDSTQTVRRDGRITMSVVGELTVTGLTPVNLEQELLKLYSNQLVSREVSVLVVSSTYPIFVSGAVGRPGKILADRPMTVLEAIMESGGFDTAKANLKAVKVVRQEATGTKTFVFDLQSTLDGKSSEPFFVKRSDIIIVPEKFTWF
jgi:polysaccharide export outer membrane protein